MRLIAPLIICSLAACATDIHAQDDTIQPSSAKFGQYQNVFIEPLLYDEEAGSAGQHIQKQLVACMRKVFKNLRPVDAGASAENNASALVIEPSIVDLKKVPSAQRIFFGPMAGSSAGLMKVQFKDQDKNVVLAEPVFYAKTNAWLGAWTLGILDNKMLSKLPREACAYAGRNF